MSEREDYLEWLVRELVTAPTQLRLAQAEMHARAYLQMPPPSDVGLPESAKPGVVHAG